MKVVGTIIRFEEFDIPDEFKGLDVPHKDLWEDDIPDEECNLRDRLIKYLKKQKGIEYEQVIRLVSFETGNALMEE